MSVSLGTLANQTGIITSAGDNVEETTFVSSVKALYSLGNMTPAASVGPLSLYWAHSDYNLAEVEDFIEGGGSWNAGNLVGREIAARKIRLVGVFGTPDDANDTVVLNDGRPVITKIKMLLVEGQTINLVTYNDGGAAFATTVPKVRVLGHANLWPK